MCLVPITILLLFVDKEINRRINYSFFLIHMQFFLNHQLFIFLQKMKLLQLHYTSDIYYLRYVLVELVLVN